MSFEQLAHRYEPITTKRFFLPQNWQTKPHLMRDSLHTMIQTGLDVLADDEMTVEFNFRMPRETHALPLFQHQLFNTLVKEHNEWTETERYIDPTTLMILDPALSGLSKSTRLVTSMHGEDIVLHELRHFWGLQDLWKQDAKGLIGIELNWKEIPKSTVQYLSIEGFFEPDEETNGQDGFACTSAPLYPSKSDHRMILKELQSIPYINNRTRHKIRDRFVADKLMEQGFRWKWLSKLFEPMTPDTMIGALFLQWKELRKDDIDFSKWSELVKLIE